MKRHTILMLLALIAICFTSCKKDRETATFTFSADIVQPTSDDKVFMEGERIVFFKEGDQISIASDLQNGAETQVGTLTISRNGNHSGIFTTELDKESQKFCAVFPYKSDIEINYTSESVWAVQSWFPRVQKYVTDETFAANAYPMVAWSTSRDNPLQFHALCGIVRIQFYAPTKTFTIDSIQFISNRNDQPISGIFTVENYTTAEPYVTTDNGTTSNTVSITGPVTVDNNGPYSFYLTLPAYDRVTTFDLTMKLYGKEGVEIKHYQKKFTTQVTRNSINKLPAINVNDWSATGLGICGNGTATRPFEIYTQEDLIKVRDAFNVGTTLNGVDVKSNDYYFTLMRTDIELTGIKWTSGINNFRGFFKNSVSSERNPGITNNSGNPIFASISSNGTVDGITVKTTGTVTLSSTASSPLCVENAGTIKNCNIGDGATFTSSSAHIAGICYHNTGTISGCSNTGTLQAPAAKNVASICYTNDGVITGCHITNNLSLSGKEIGGICYQNNKTIEDCYFNATQISSATSSWGGIAFIMNNSDATITQCQIQSNGNMSISGSCGGIVHTLTNGLIDYCGNLTTNSFTANYNGGIVANMNGGEVRNCYCDNRTANAVELNLNGSGYCGGIVAEMTAGLIFNSYAYCKVFGTNSGTVVGNFRGGSIENCYGYAPTSGHRFYASSAPSVTTGNCYNYIVNQSAPDVTSFTDASTLPGLLNPQTSTTGREWIYVSGHPTLSTTAPATSKKTAMRLNRYKRK